MFVVFFSDFPYSVYQYNSCLTIICTFLLQGIVLIFTTVSKIWGTLNASSSNLKKKIGHKTRKEKIYQKRVICHIFHYASWKFKWRLLESKLQNANLEALSGRRNYGLLYCQNARQLVCWVTVLFRQSETWKLMWLFSSCVKAPDMRHDNF